MFQTDTRTESFLTMLGACYTYSNNISFDSLAPRWDAFNLGRSTPKVKKAIDNYGVLMDQGSIAPAPILSRKPGGKKYNVCDGVQRLLAFEARNPMTFSAYVVTTDSVAHEKKIRCFANLRLQGGFQEPAEWTLERAIVTLLHGKLATVDEIAELGGWTKSSVRCKIASVDTQIAVCAIGGPDFPDTFLRLIAKYSDPSDFEKAPSELCTFLTSLDKLQLSAADAEPYIHDFFTLNRNSKHNQRLRKNLDTFENDEEVSRVLADPMKRRVQSMTPEGKLIKSLKGALTSSENMAKDNARLVNATECYRILNQIKKTIEQIDRRKR